MKLHLSKVGEAEFESNSRATVISTTSPKKHLLPTVNQLGRSGFWGK